MQPDDDINSGPNPYAPPVAVSTESDSVVRETVLAHEFKPFRTIWTRPRDTVRQIIAVNPELHVVLLVCLAGIGESLDRSSGRNAGDQMPLWAIIGAACVGGPLGGLLSLWVGSHLIRISGKWIGGAASRQHIKTAIAWASVPAVFALPLWIPNLLLFGAEMFTEATPSLDAQPILWIPFLGIMFVEIVLSVWAFVLLCNTVAEVQGFRSAWRGFGNIVLAGAAIVVPLLAIAAVASLLSKV
ncbi:MAG: Yip1 family protein [Pirellulales bacterium]